MLRQCSCEAGNSWGPGGAEEWHGLRRSVLLHHVVGAVVRQLSHQQQEVRHVLGEHEHVFYMNNYVGTSHEEMNKLHI